MNLRIATVVALASSLVLGPASTLLFVAAFGFRPELFAEPAGIVERGATAAALFKWAAIADLFSYYLPTGVVAIGLWVTLRGRSEPLALAGLAAALGYALLGGAGASLLAFAGAPLIEAYGAPGADQPAIRTVFAMLVDIVFRAVWQFVDGILLTVWMGSVGLLLRPDRPALARLSLVLAALFGAGAAVNALGLGLARDALLGIVFVLWAAWWIWLAVLVWRREPPFALLDSASPSSS